MQFSWTQHVFNYAFCLFMDLEGLILQISLNDYRCSCRNIIITNIISSYVVNGNVNILFDNNSKSQLDAVLYCYNLACIIKFLTRIVLNSHIAIGDEFLYSSAIGK